MATVMLNDVSPSNNCSEVSDNYVSLLVTELLIFIQRTAAYGTVNLLT